MIRKQRDLLEEAGTTVVQLEKEKKNLAEAVHNQNKALMILVQRSRPSRLRWRWKALDSGAGRLIQKQATWMLPGELASIKESVKNLEKYVQATLNPKPPTGEPSPEEEGGEEEVKADQAVDIQEVQAQGGVTVAAGPVP
jgi:hypothetical protein